MSFCVYFSPAAITQVCFWTLAESAFSTLRDEEWNDLITCSTQYTDVFIYFTCIKNASQSAL